MGASQASEIVDRWSTKLRTIPDRCVEVIPSPDDGTPQIFDLWVLGDVRLTSIWDSFSKSPISRLLRPSHIVSAAVARNEFLFLPTGPRASSKASSETYERVLAMHLRRGDYEDACQGFSKWNSTFYGWNLLASLPDSFTPPSGGVWGENTPENIAVYMEHCYPDIESVVQKIRQAKKEYRGGYVDVLYLLTNEKGQWLNDLLAAFKADGWTTIRTSRDLVLENVEQTEVAMAIDMDIARRAGVFVGNGWSSFTSNIVHRRLVDGKPPSSIRFY